MIQNIINFYRNPYAYFSVGGRESIKERIVALRKSYFFCLYITLMIVLLIAIIDGILKNILNISIFENLQRMRNEFSATNSRVSSFVQMCLITPFIEESFFRLPLLVKSSSLIWVIFFVFIQSYIVGTLQLEIFFWWYYAILIFIFAVIMLFTSISAKRFEPVLEAKNYNYLCWGLTIAFALMHVANFAPLHMSVFYLYPIYVLPQFVHGVVLSFLAIRYNSIVWPFLLHAAINSTAEIHRLLNDIF